MPVKHSTTLWSNTFLYDYQVNVIYVANFNTTDVDPECFTGTLLCDPGLQEASYNTQNSHKQHSKYND